MTKPNKFTKKYDITVLDSNKRYVRRHQPIMFTDPNDKNVIVTQPDPIEETILTISIPAFQLDKLAKLDELVFNTGLNKSDSYQHLLELLMNQAQQEKMLRQQNEAVRLAYEHYSTLLHLTGHKKTVDL